MNTDDHIGILIHHADLTISKYVRKQLEPFNLAPEQNLIMMMLWNQDGISSNELIVKLQKDKANIARMITSLEKKEYIKKVNDPIDKRTFKVYLTEQGKQLAPLVLPAHQKIRETLTKGLAQEEIDELNRLITKITHNIAGGHHS